jgi:FKBP-type peptidyl-prolyl cis-trans isomerase FkpA
MRLRLVILAAATASLVGCSQAPAPTPKTDDEKLVYALGVIASKQIPLQSFELSEQEMELVKAGFTDSVRDKALLDEDAVRAMIPKLQEMQGKRAEIGLKRAKDEGAAYVTKAAAESGAKKTASGLVYKIEKEGTGAQPQASDTVKVHYIGKFIDGKEFDNSHKHQPPGPAEFPLNGVIPCWTEGLQLLKVGGKARLVCPSDIAYGDQVSPPMRPGATLVFEDVELLEIVKPGAAAAAPAPAASPHGATPR